MNARSSLNNSDSGKHQRRSTFPAASSHSSSRETKRLQRIQTQAISHAALMPQLSSRPNQTEVESGLRRIARAKAQQGDYADAIQILTQLIRRNSDSANDYNNRGLIYFQSGQREKAIADYNKAIQLNPQLAGAYNNRANYYASQGQLEAAIADYEKTLDLNPVHIRAWINQGITYRDMGLYDRAIENFDFALRLGWLEGHIYAERGRTYHLMGDWNFAVADYRRALEQFPQPNPSNPAPTTRLHQQVKTWLNELISPFKP